MQGACEGGCLGGGTQIGLGDNFQQGRACTVQVDTRARLAMRAYIVFVQGFASVLFEVSARQLNGVICVFELEFDLPPFKNGAIKLADLIVFGQVRIKIVLACKLRGLVNSGTYRKAKHDGLFSNSAVKDGQGTRQGQIDLVCLGIWFGTKGGAAAGKNLGSC